MNSVIKDHNYSYEMLQRHILYMKFTFFGFKDVSLFSCLHAVFHDHRRFDRNFISCRHKYLSEQHQRLCENQSS